MHIRVLGEIGIDTGAIKGLLHGRPGLTWEAAHRHRAVGAVIRVMEIRVVLQFFKIRQHLVIRPLGVAPGCPGVKILRGATDKRLAIDGAGTTSGFAPRYGHGLGLVGIGRPHKGPVIGCPVLACFQVDGAPPIFQHVRKVCRIGEVRAGLQKEHRAARVLGQTGRQNTACSATTDDNRVITHGLPFHESGCAGLLTGRIMSRLRKEGQYAERSAMISARNARRV